MPENVVCICGGMSFPSVDFSDGLEIFSKRIVGKTMLYSGVNTGLIGQLADLVLAAGGVVNGALLEEELEMKHPKLKKYTYFKTYKDRQEYIFEVSSKVFFLPGGLGTFCELFTLLIENKMREKAKPVELVNLNNFWEPVKKLLQFSIDCGFVDFFDVEYVKSGDYSGKVGANGAAAFLQKNGHGFL